MRENKANCGNWIKVWMRAATELSSYQESWPQYQNYPIFHKLSQSQPSRLSLPGYPCLKTHFAFHRLLIVCGAISDSSQFEWETRTMCFFSRMIYMIIVGRLNADGALLICIHHSGSVFRSSLSSSSSEQHKIWFFYEDNNSARLSRADPIWLLFPWFNNENKNSHRTAAIEIIFLLTFVCAF